MKYFTLLLLFISLAFASFSGKSFLTSKNYLQEGGDLRNTYTFSSREICGSSLPYLNKTIYSIPTGSFNLGEPSVVSRPGGAMEMFYSNRDCNITKVDFKTGEKLFSFPLSNYGGRPCTPGDTSVLSQADWSRSTPALIGSTGSLLGFAEYFSAVNIDQAIVCNTGRGNATCYHFDPDYIGSGTPNLIGSYTSDPDPGAIHTASPICYPWQGKRVCLASTSSRTEFFPILPDLNPTFVGGVFAYDADTFETLWTFRTAPLTGGYAGCAVVGTPTIDFESQKILFTTNNNYEVPDAIKNCIAANGDCSDQDDPNNRPDSLIVLNLDGTFAWSQERSGSRAPDTWDITCAFGACQNFTGDDGGPLSSPNVFDCYDGVARKTVRCVSVAYKRAEVPVYNLENGNLIKLFKTGPGSDLGGGHAFGSSYSKKKNQEIFNNHNPEGLSWTLVDGTVTNGPFMTVIDYDSMAIIAQRELEGSSFGGPTLVNDRWIFAHNRNNNLGDTYQVHDLEAADLEVVHGQDLGCTMGNPIICIDNTCLFPCSYAFSDPSNPTDIIAVGLDEVNMPSSAACF